VDAIFNAYSLNQILFSVQYCIDLFTAAALNLNLTLSLTPNGPNPNPTGAEVFINTSTRLFHGHSTCDIVVPQCP